MLTRHLSLLVFLNAMLGFNLIAGKIGTGVFGPLLFTTIRFAIVLLLLFPFLRIVSGQMRLIFIIGVCLGVGHYAIMFYAVHLGDNVSSIAIASQLTGPFATIFAIFILQERIGIIRSVAIAMSFIGVVVISFEPVSGQQQILALLIASIASAFLAAAAIMIRRLEGVGVFNLQAWIALISTLCLSVFTLAIEAPSLQDMAALSINDYWSVLYSAIGATIIGQGSMYYLLQRYPVNQVAPFNTLSALFAIASGVWLVGDILTTRMLMGGALTLVAVTIIAQRNAVSAAPSGIRVPR